MKTRIMFNLPEDEHTMKLIIHGVDFALVCSDMDEELRQKLKYGHKFESADEALEWTRDKLREVMYKRSVNLEMIY